MDTVNSLLTFSQKTSFAEDGFLLCKDFFDLKKDIEPIQKAIYQVIGLVIQRHGLDISQDVFSPENFDSGFSDLIAVDRSYGSEFYDIIKQIPAFLRLVSGEVSERCFKALRETDLTGIGAASYGIRIDNPFEDRFRSDWHQEFLYQPQSVDGIVMWTPLLAVTPEMGPVNICRGSHKNGLCRYKKHTESGRTGVYQISIFEAEHIVSQYECVAPLTEPGDLLIMDYLTIHQSGFNISYRSRWSIQYRLFNFRDPIGCRLGWKPSVALGTDIESIFAEHFINEEF